MALDNIQLPPVLHQLLFNNKLVDLRDNAARAFDQSVLKIDYLGGNEKNIVFIINNEKHKFLDDLQLKFLSNLVSACNLTMADVAVVNMHNNIHINYYDLSEALSGRKVLCFNVSPADIGLPFNIPSYQVQTFQEIQYLFCPGLEQLQDKPQAKKELWGSLQKIFNIAAKK